MQKETDMHEYPSGKRVIKSFTPLGWIIYNNDNAIINATNADN
jgi:hypothetical protein